MHVGWDRLIRFRAKEDQQVYFGQPVDGEQDVGLAWERGEPIRAAVLTVPSAGHPSMELLAAGTPDAQTVRTVDALLAPLSREQIGTIRALGANFVQPAQTQTEADVAQAKAQRPPIPILFYKPLSALQRPGGGIAVPRVAADETDYEVELLVVLGRACKDVSAEEALDYVLGYSLANDVSARKRMFAVPQWGLGKSFDTFLPVGV